MANSGAVWGIDIGQCALKALRCRPHEKESGRIVIEAYDYIEYPKILSQPEADRDELIRDALELFLSRNEVKNDRVAISVPGQSGLSRFIKLPPVEKKKIPDIVKYEARQQIPFALEDVVWDYQPLISAGEDEGYALDTEVGLFAMKRDQVAKALEPFETAGIDVHVVQLSPLAIYNYACFDRMNNLEGAEAFDPDNPPESTVVISLGTDTTDLVITNGFRVWQRNIPIGGSHFTKSLTKELKLTFSKAEHLKRNATKADDPKAIFQAMRPVYSDLVAEIQRSLGFFSTNNRKAKLGEVVVVGNAIKLPGLQRYLAQNLEQKVVPVAGFANLAGGSTAATQQFTENQLSFPVAYGLCVQALDRSQIHTNLLPEEIVTSRLVRAKKPWVVAAAATLFLGMVINYSSHHASWKSADIGEQTNPDMARALKDSASLTSRASGYSNTNEGLKTKFESVVTLGDSLQSNVDGRLLWLEMFKAVDSALPRDTRPDEERQETAEDVSIREELHIEHMDCEHFDDLATWFSTVSDLWAESQKEFVGVDEQAAIDAAAEASAEGDPDAAAEDEAFAADDPGAGMDDFGGDEGFADGEEGAEGGTGNGPTGAGWVIQLNGYHFHNGVDLQNESENFVQKTFIKNLLEGTIELPDGPNGELVDVPIADLGIGFPVILTQNALYDVQYDPEATDEKGARSRRRSPPDPRPTSRPRRNRKKEKKPKERVLWTLTEYDFVIQFSWSPTPRTERLNKTKGGTAESDDVDTASVGSHRVR